MIICIDGPAGAGKSTVARQLAEKLGFRMLDTGAMYRAVAWAAQRENIDWSDAQAIVEVAGRIDIKLFADRVLVGEADVSEAIRTPEVTSLTHYAADNPGVRAHLVEQQRQIAVGLDLVTEGRDQGTVVFPGAEHKFFVTASPTTRAHRRWQELTQRGSRITLDEVLRQQQARDERDSTREVGPLKPAADAVIVSTDELSIDQVVDQLAAAVRSTL